MDSRISEALETILEKTADVLEAMTVSFDDQVVLQHSEPTAPSIKEDVGVILENLNQACTHLHALIDQNPQIARLPNAPYVPILAQQNIQEAIGLEHHKATTTTTTTSKPKSGTTTT